ncbi:hypothetical protein KJ918_01835, partial [Patescibacteria group bacterium]|nr:hypothetical protein [Patescibacteria group bacterium]
MKETQRLETVFFVGKPKDGGWSGVSVKPESSSGVLELGRLFSLVTIKAPNEFDSIVAGGLLCDAMQEEYYSAKAESSVERLAKAIMAVAKKLEFLLQRENVAAAEGIDLSIEALVVQKGFVYLAVLGEGGIMLLRDGALINLTEGLKDLSGRNLISSGSGKYEI